MGDISWSTESGESFPGELCPIIDDLSEAKFSGKVRAVNDLFFLEGVGFPGEPSCWCMLLVMAQEPSVDMASDPAVAKQEDKVSVITVGHGALAFVSRLAQADATCADFFSSFLGGLTSLCSGSLKLYVSGLLESP